jgi:integrase
MDWQHVDLDGKRLTIVHTLVVTRTFQARARQAGLLVIRLHDLRHSWPRCRWKLAYPRRSSRTASATRRWITLNVYSHVTPQLQTDAADKVAALIFGGAD